MSTYKKLTKHPNTGQWEYALWIDDCFGNHHYGVQFPSEPDVYYDPRVDHLETVKPEGSASFTADPYLPIRYVPVSPLTVFIVLITFLIVAAMPWVVYSNVQTMCHDAMMEAMIDTY